jgi:hypothetical protein
MAITICNPRWTPECRVFDVNTLVSLSTLPTIRSTPASEPEQSFSIEIKDLNRQQLEKILELLKADTSKINISA